VRNGSVVVAKRDDPEFVVAGDALRFADDCGDGEGNTSVSPEPAELVVLGPSDRYPPEPAEIVVCGPSNRYPSVPATTVVLFPSNRYPFEPAESVVLGPSDTYSPGPAKIVVPGPAIAVEDSVAADEAALFSTVADCMSVPSDVTPGTKRFASTADEEIVREVDSADNGLVSSVVGVREISIAVSD
jgi:hypothetical protein